MVEFFKKHFCLQANMYRKFDKFDFSLPKDALPNLDEIDEEQTGEETDDRQQGISKVHFSSALTKIHYSKL